MVNNQVYYVTKVKCNVKGSCQHLSQAVRGLKNCTAALGKFILTQILLHLLSEDPLQGRLPVTCNTRPSPLVHTFTWSHRRNSLMCSGTEQGLREPEAVAHRTPAPPTPQASPAIRVHSAWGWEGRFSEVRVDDGWGGAASPGSGWMVERGAAVPRRRLMVHGGGSASPKSG